MNYAEYMRKLQSGRSQIIHSPSGQDASLVTLKQQARAQTIKTPVAVETNFSQIGGAKGNILEATQQTCSPTSAVCSSGYKGVSQGFATTDATGNVLGAAQHCAVCSDPPSSEPYAVEIPCGIFIAPPQNAPGKTVCCSKDMSVLFTNNQELVADQGRQQTLRQHFNLPSKLQGLRGGVVYGR
jgi:hypothetical protein